MKKLIYLLLIFTFPANGQITVEKNKTAADYFKMELNEKKDTLLIICDCTIYKVYFIASDENAKPINLSHSDEINKVNISNLPDGFYVVMTSTSKGKILNVLKKNVKTRKLKE